MPSKKAERSTSTRTPEAKKGRQNKVATPAAASPIHSTPKRSHPSYSDMVIEALSESRETKGMNKTSIMKYIQNKHDLRGSTVDSTVKRTLRKMLDDNLIAHVNSNSVGAAGSFKIASGRATKQQPRQSPSSSPSPSKRTASSSKLPTKPKARKVIAPITSVVGFGVGSPVVSVKRDGRK